MANGSIINLAGSDNDEPPKKSTLLQNILIELDSYVLF